MTKTETEILQKARTLLDNHKCTVIQLNPFAGNLDYWRKVLIGKASWLKAQAFACERAANYISKLTGDYK